MGAVSTTLMGFMNKVYTHLNARKILIHSRNHISHEQRLIQVKSLTELLKIERRKKYYVGHGNIKHNVVSNQETK